MGNSSEIDVRHLPDWFWDTIAQAEGDDENMTEILRQMTTAQLREFNRLFTEAGWALWEEPYTQYMGYGSGSVTEDSIEDQAFMAVTQGKDYFLKVLDNPERLADMGDDWPDLSTEATKVFTERYGYGIGEEEIYGVAEELK